MSGPHFPGMGEDGPDPSATPIAETVELLATALWMFFDQPEDRSSKQNDYLIRAASAVDAFVATAVAAAVREERERLTIPDKDIGRLRRVLHLAWTSSGSMGDDEACRYARDVINRIEANRV